MYVANTYNRSCSLIPTQPTFSDVFKSILMAYRNWRRRRKSLTHIPMLVFTNHTYLYNQECRSSIFCPGPKVLSCTVAARLRIVWLERRSICRNIHMGLTKKQNNYQYRKKQVYTIWPLRYMAPYFGAIYVSIYILDFVFWTYSSSPSSQSTSRQYDNTGSF